MALPTIFDNGNKNLVRGRRLVRLTANGTITIPAGALLRRIYFRNRTANAVTGGIRIGTAAAGTQVVTAQAVAANAIVSILPTIENYQAAAQTLYIEAVTSWNSADVDVTVTYEEITTCTQPSNNTVQS
jgi:hypothetical protein